MTIIEAVTPKAKRAGRGITPPEVYAFFVEQCRANLHMVLAMSPVGDAFRFVACMHSTPLHAAAACHKVCLSSHQMSLFCHMHTSALLQSMWDSHWLICQESAKVKQSLK